MASFTIRCEHPSDEEAREALLDASLGLGRKAKTSERLRAGRKPAAGLALIAQSETQGILGSIRLWPVQAGSAGSVLLLGPLGVMPGSQGQGIGSALMREALTRARTLGYGAIILVGDADYYKRFGFSAALTTSLLLPGPVERSRFLGFELQDKALAGAAGYVTVGKKKKMMVRPSPKTLAA